MSQQSRIANLITAIGADIKALTTSVSGKANTSHTHAPGDITGGATPVWKSNTPPSDTSWIWVDTTGL